jgi:hypothetical protein
MAFAVVLAKAPAGLAQTNIDQGKPPSELFANYCAVCHKTTRGLATGKSALTISLFLREHYATSREQAAALAAYVISAGGNAPAPAGKPEQAREEPKGPEPKGHEPKAQEAKGHEPKYDTKPHATSALAKPESDKPGQGRQPGHEEAPTAEPETAPVAAVPPPNQAPIATPGAGPSAAPTAAPSDALNPAASPAEPEPTEPSAATSAGVGSEAVPGENAPVPRDNIPD